MEVVEHEPNAWFLLKEDQTYFLDVNCSSSAVGFGILIQLTDDECREYLGIGRIYIQYLAARVQFWPTQYASRNLSRTHGTRVGSAIAAWRIDH